MKVYFIILYFLFSCTHSDFEFTFQESIEIERLKPLCISNHNCFDFKTDNNLYNLIMFYSNKSQNKSIKLDEVDFSPYKSVLHSFKPIKKDSYVILWETEYEHYWQINSYYITKNKIEKMGEFAIFSSVMEGESKEYSIKNIRIFKKGDEIEFSFLGDVNYKHSKTNDWQFYKGGNLKYRFNIESKKARILTTNL